MSGVGSEAATVYQSASSADPAADGTPHGLPFKLIGVTVLDTFVKASPAKEGGRDVSSRPSCGIALLSAPVVPMQAAPVPTTGRNPE